ESVVVVRLVIRDSRSYAQHGLGSDLVSQSQAWPKGKGIIACELAIAAAAAVPFVNHGAQMTACTRIGCGAGENPVEPMFFLQVGREVVAESVIQGEFTRHFPGVLRKPRDRVCSHASHIGNGRVPVVHRAQEKTRIGKTYGAGESHSVQGRQSALI